MTRSPRGTLAAMPTLSFRATLPIEELRALMIALASALSRSELAFERVSQEKLGDKNHDDRCFRTVDRCAPWTLTTEVVNGSGNPMDRYGYHCTLALTRDGDAMPFVLHVMDDSSATQEPAISARISATVLGSDYERLRAVLRDRLGAQTDECDALPELALRASEYLRSDRAGALATLAKFDPLGDCGEQEHTFYSELQTMRIEHLADVTPQIAQRWNAVHPSHVPARDYAFAAGHFDRGTAAETALVTALCDPWSPLRIDALDEPERSQLRRVMAALLSAPEFVFTDERDRHYFEQQTPWQIAAENGRSLLAWTNAPPRQTALEVLMTAVRSNAVGPPLPWLSRWQARWRDEDRSHKRCVLQPFDAATPRSELRAQAVRSVVINKVEHGAALLWGGLAKQSLLVWRGGIERAAAARVCNIG